MNKRFDLIINTVSADLETDKYLGLLALNGVFCYVGLPENAQSFNLFPLVGRNRVITGSNIGGIPETQEMLDFCAEHGLGAEVEVISADQVTGAYDRVVNSDCATASSSTRRRSEVGQPKRPVM